MFWAVQGLNIFFWSTKSFASKNQTAPDFFFFLESITFGEVTSGEAPQGTGNDWKNLPGTAQTVVSVCVGSA